jgi:hypothetical protein
MYYMNIMRGFMLLGSLGRVWATSNRAKNVYQSISILAYFKLMNDFENGKSNYVAIIPEIRPPGPPIEPKQVNHSGNRERQRKLSQTMRQVNFIINERR